MKIEYHICNMDVRSRIRNKVSNIIQNHLNSNIKFDCRVDVGERLAIVINNGTWDTIQRINFELNNL